LPAIQFVESCEIIYAEWLTTEGNALYEPILGAAFVQRIEDFESYYIDKDAFESHNTLASTHEARTCIVQLLKNGNVAGLASAV
jgi:hypothetical protein